MKDTVLDKKRLRYVIFMKAALLQKATSPQTYETGLSIYETKPIFDAKPKL